MKKYLLASTLLVLGAYGLAAQTTMREKMLKDRKEFSDRTLFQRFEQEMVPTAEQRKTKKQQNQERRLMLLTIIDTTQIKADHKQKLKYDVVHNPFSKRLRKFMEKHEVNEKMKLRH
jgi:hypothetical protein